MINKKFPSGDKFYREKRQASADKEKKEEKRRTEEGNNCINTILFYDFRCYIEKI